MIEDVEVNAIRTIEPAAKVDFVEYNPNFKAQKGTLIARGTYDVKVNPSVDLKTKRPRTDTVVDCQGGSPDPERSSPMHGVLTYAGHLIRNISTAWHRNRSTKRVVTFYSSRPDATGIR